jgi:hypothetical protein
MDLMGEDNPRGTKRVGTEGRLGRWNHGPGWGFACKTRGKTVPQPLCASLFLRNTEIWNHD